MKHYNDFTNLYSLSKTLRFELRPVGKTAENIKKAKLITEDEKRASDYQVTKRAIDAFHRVHIEEALALVEFTNSDIDGFIESLETLYFKPNKDEKDKEGIKKYQEQLRNWIVNCLEGKENKSNASKKKSKEIEAHIKRIKERYDILFKKDLFDNEEFLALAKEKGYDEIVSNFKGFTSYFTGFHENRGNMYSSGEESTSIAYRIIHENLPKFLENKRNYAKIKAVIPKTKLQEVEKGLKDILGKTKLEEVFTTDYFQKVLNQSGINLYNTIIGGKPAKEGEKKIQGLNEIINLSRQQNPDLKIPSLKILYKQILSESEEGGFKMEAFEKDKDLLNAIKEFWETVIIKNKNLRNKNLMDMSQSLFQKMEKYSSEKLSGIFVENKNITNLSLQVFGEWSVLNKALSESFDSLNQDRAKTKNYEKEKKQFLKSDYFSLKEIEDASRLYRNLQSNEFKSIPDNPIRKFFTEFKVKVEENKKEKWVSISEEIYSAYKILEPILKEDRKEQKNLNQEKAKVEKIKSFLDSLKTLQNFLKLLSLSEPVDDKHHTFYDELESCYEEISPLSSLYNKARNYLTRKPYSEEKFKLNFESPTLLNGWDKNKETANLAIILRKDNLYYLGIMEKKNNKVFEEKPKSNGNDIYEKMIYKLLPGPNKMLPKVFFSDKGAEKYSPSKSLLELYSKGEFKLGDNFKLSSLHKLIDFYKESIEKNEDWKTFGFQFSPTKKFEDISSFYREVEEQGYKISFEKIDSSYIDSLVEEGKLFLFQIYNKDFSQYSSGKPNLHTIYWKSLFEKENLKDVVYKLNGEAEVFYRPKSIEYSKEILQKGHHAKDLAGKFKYPIIKDKRYSEDKFQFHVPITLNFHPKLGGNINQPVQEFLSSAKNFHIIGIDRGERHLLYLSLINSKGEIIKQESLNTILNEHSKKPIDFREKLDGKERERDDARKNWDVIENIKELKEGYLSQIVHKISKLMVEYNAILVMEDLNFGFKRGRFKVEKQVYQKFEKMLIDKLNYLVFKENKPTEAGGSLKAYQLTNQFESFQKLGKQSGMIFYVPANHTSKIDPSTGFFNFLYPDVTSLEKGKDFFDKFDKIHYNAKKDYFEFHCKYGNFVGEPSSEKKSKREDLVLYNKIKGKTWIICSTKEERFRSFKNNSGHVEYKSIDVNAEIKKLLGEASIDYSQGKDLKSQVTASESTSFLKSLAENLKILLAMRYNNGKKESEERDFIHSPVANSDGKFFHSEKVSGKQPDNADANGAYNIARKGLLLVEKIKQQKGNKKPDLSISNLDWFEFAWNRNEL